MKQTTTKPVGTASPTGFKPFNFLADNQTADLVNFRYSNELTQTEKLKRHLIFRSLIAELRGERFEPDERKEFSYRIVDLPKLNHSRNFGGLDDSDLDTLGVCAIPNFILNALVCESLAKRFGDLSVCGCFYKVGDVWRLDVDEQLSRKGLFLPVRSGRNYLIEGLKVFRHSEDQRPFMLKLRGTK